MALNLPMPIKVIVNESGVFVKHRDGMMEKVEDDNVEIHKGRKHKEINNYEDFYEHLWDNYGLRNEEY